MFPKPTLLVSKNTSNNWIFKQFNNQEIIKIKSFIYLYKLGHFLNRNFQVRFLKKYYLIPVFLIISMDYSETSSRT